ncbi:unnamed protein product [Camellia sinensis]
MGLAAAEGARVSGASRIIGVDLNSNRHEQEVISEMTNGGVDRSVECTGSTEAMISAFECVHDGWGVVLVRVPHKDAVFNTHPELKLEKFITHQVPFSEINKAFEYMLKGESIRCIIKMEE